MSAEIIAGWDFKAKKRFKPEQAPVTNQVKSIAQGLSLDTPPEVLAAIYESSMGGWKFDSNTKMWTETDPA